MLFSRSLSHCITIYCYPVFLCLRLIKILCSCMLLCLNILYVQDVLSAISIGSIIARCKKRDQLLQESRSTCDGRGREYEWVCVPKV